MDSEELNLVRPLKGSKLVRPLSVDPETTGRADSKQRLLRLQTTMAQPTNRRSSLTELRKATRYRLTSIAVIRWLDADHELREAFALVYDISTCGVYVESEVPLFVSTNVELEITSPNLGLATPSARLNFEGRIVRSKSGDGRTGLAVAGSLYLSARAERRY